MQPVQIIDAVAGTTLRATWVNSGVIPASIYSRVLAAGDTLINCYSGVSSGNGFYYAPHTLPGSQQWLVNEWVATIDGFVYKNRQLIRVRELKVG